MSTEPGRLTSLGVEVDRADALAVIGVVQAWGPRPRRLVRSAITAGFEYPRYPRPLMLRGVKLPAPWPWSPTARAEAARATSEGRPDRPVGLVHEHVRPIGDVVAAVVDRPELRNPDALAAFLFENLTYAVISKAEDARLTEADTRAKATGIAIDADADPWARYRLAGLDVTNFAPLDLPGTRRSTATGVPRSDGRTCSKPGCDRPLYSNGLCKAHHSEDRNHNPERPVCAVAGCHRRQTSRGVCAACFANAQNRGLWRPGKGTFPTHVLEALARR